MNFQSEPSKWVDMGEYLYIPGKIDQNIDKIYAFDLDGTLTTAKNGMDPIKYNDIGPDNWLFLGPVIEIINNLSKDYNIFIISNQYNVSQLKLIMIQSVWTKLNYIPTILCAHKKNHFRKPNPYFLNVIDSLMKIDLTKSYYSGDSVGPDDPFVPYRWNTYDSDFAKNACINFIRPINVFGTSNFVPTEDIVIMMGTPGCLKTTFAKNLEKYYGYIRLSKDEVGDLEKKYNQIGLTLQQGRKFVLDATFAKLSSRLPWIKLANQLNKSIVICWIIRDGRPWNKLREKPVSHFAYSSKNGYCQNFNDPEELILQPNMNFRVEIIY
jgi:DNA 3'-phosphatase